MVDLIEPGSNDRSEILVSNMFCGRRIALPFGYTTSSKFLWEFECMHKHFRRSQTALFLYHRTARRIPQVDFCVRGLELLCEIAYPGGKS